MIPFPLCAPIEHKDRKFADLKLYGGLPPPRLSYTLEHVKRGRKDLKPSSNEGTKITPYYLQFPSKSSQVGGERTDRAPIHSALANGWTMAWERRSRGRAQAQQLQKVPGSTPTISRQSREKLLPGSLEGCCLSE